MVLLAVTVVFTGTPWAEEVFISGVVTVYEEGDIIKVNDDRGEKHSFTIAEDTEVVGEIKTGATVEVEAKDGVAAYIGEISLEPAEEELEEQEAEAN